MTSDDSNDEDTVSQNKTISEEDSSQYISSKVESSVSVSMNNQSVSTSKKAAEVKE